MSTSILLLFFLIGLVIYVRFSEFVVVLENDNEFNTVRHEVLVNIAGVGLLISFLSMVTFTKIFKDRKAKIVLSDIVIMAVGFLLVAILTPIGMTELVGANTTLWNTSVATIFQTLLPILYIIGIAIAYVKYK